MKRIKIVSLIVITFSLICIFSFAQAKGQTESLPKLIVFYSPGCHNCIHIKNEVMPGIESRFKGKITVVYRDIDDIENYKFMLSLEEKYHAQINNISPVFFFEGHFVNGEGNVKIT